MTGSVAIGADLIRNIDNGSRTLSDVMGQKTERTY